MYKIYLSILTLILSGCFSINPSTVQLSERVGVQLAEMETLHILTVQRYFDGEREKIKHCLTNTWEPLFLKNFLGTSNVLSMLQNVSTFEDTTRENITEGLKLYLNDPTESEAAAKTILDNLNISRQGEQEAVRSVLNDYVEDDRLEAATVHISSLLGSDNAAQIILEFAEAAHEEMQAQREALLAPLEAKRETVIAELSGAYSVLVRGQSTITGRLDAASKRTGDRDFLMDKLGVGKTPDLIMQQLSGISTQVDKALSGANRVLNKGEGDPIKGVIDILKADLESMNEKEEEQEMDDKN